MSDDRVLCWSCPECAFTFDAMHTDANGETYTCPACAELRLEAERDAARAAIARIEALCEQAVAEYQPHDVTPWVAVHELRAALAGE